METTTMRGVILRITEPVKRIESKQDGILTVICQVGGHAQCSNIIQMPNGDTQGVSHHFLKFYTDTVFLESTSGDP